MHVFVILSDWERVFLDWGRTASLLVPCKPQRPELKPLLLFQLSSSAFPHLPGRAISKTQSHVRNSHKYEYTRKSQ